MQVKEGVKVQCMSWRMPLMLTLFNKSSPINKFLRDIEGSSCISAKVTRTLLSDSKIVQDDQELKG